jgi:hypothetical protein
VTKVLRMRHKCARRDVRAAEFAVEGYNGVGVFEQVIESTEPVPTGRVLLASLEREGEGIAGEGRLTLHMRERAVGDGGTIHKRVIDVCGEPFVDLANEAAMAFAGD